jgi:hypothetical protein
MIKSSTSVAALALLAVVLATSAPAAAHEALWPATVNKDPAKYHRQKVVIKGHMFMGRPEYNHVHAITRSKGISWWRRLKYRMGWYNLDGPPSKDCLTVANYDEVWDWLKGDVADRKVVVQGWFYSDYLERVRYDFGACDIGTGIIVEKILSVK